jgi:SLA1 homology domain 1, SHD1
MQGAAPQPQAAAPTYQPAAQPPASTNGNMPGNSMSPASNMPANNMPNSMGGGEMLVPPQVPSTHEGKPIKVEKPAEAHAAQQPSEVQQPAQPATKEEATPQAPQNLDDLFGPSAAAPSDAEDLFGPAKEAAPAEKAAPDNTKEMPAEPAASNTGDKTTPEPAAQTETPPADESAAPAETEGNFEDLFGAPTEEKSTTPATEPAPDTQSAPSTESTPTDDKDKKKEDDSSFDDLFGREDAILQQSGGLASVGLRRWVDNSGEYTCRGRLVDVQNGRVILLKDNGRTATVPLDRLSQADLSFVQRQASAQRAISIDRTVRTTPAWPTH